MNLIHVRFFSVGLTIQFRSWCARVLYSPISFSSWSLRSQKGSRKKPNSLGQSGRQGIRWTSPGPTLPWLAVQAPHRHHLVSALCTSGMWFQWYFVESCCLPRGDFETTQVYRPTPQTNLNEMLSGVVKRATTRSSLNNTARLEKKRPKENPCTEPWLCISRRKNLVLFSLISSVSFLHAHLTAAYDFF